jgi:CRP/FNR family transcriptional regulator, nitrogen oxide reductase regulator
MATQVLSGRERIFTPTPAPTASTTNNDNLLKLSFSAIFAGLSQRDLMEILACARMRSFTRDEVLYTQGQAARTLIVLQSGSVKHTQLSSNGDEVLLRMSGTGEALNLQAAPVGCNHSCSARAMENCRAWVWEYNKLQELLDRYPRMRANITQVLASRLQELEERFREVATEKVARRLALVLIRLMKQIGKSTHEGTMVSLRREDLAQMTGTTLFTISRVLSRWAEQGLVVPKREAVVIVDGKRLETESEYDV